MMRLFELFEGKPKEKGVLPPPRNPVARAARKSGAGAHTPSKYTRKEKHKHKTSDE
jgi:hypothetical protein